jgi:hypothetical protein
MDEYSNWAELFVFLAVNGQRVLAPSTPSIEDQTMIGVP